MAVKILQLNVQRSIAAAAEVKNLLVTGEYDIACLQEPYSYKNKIMGYSSPSLTVFQPAGWYPWAGIVVGAGRASGFQLRAGGSEHVVCVRVKCGLGSIIVISVYCQFSKPIREILDPLERCLRGVRGNRVLVCADVNGRSPCWFSSGSDQRGQAFENFIIANDLVVLNRRQELHTFASSQGQSNIDVSLASPSLAPYIADWKVADISGVSDHNAIVLEWHPDAGHDELRLVVTPEFNIRKANWEELEVEIGQKFDLRAMAVLRDADAETAARTFGSLLTAACEGTIPRRRLASRTVPWWTAEIDIHRRRVREAKKQLARARRLQLNNANQCALRYRQERNRYVALIRKEKTASWHNFVSSEGNRDPWGFIHKITSNKIQKKTDIGALRLPAGGYTMSWRESASLLLERFAPADGADRANEGESHRRTRLFVARYSNENLEPDITEQEIEVALKGCKSGKAPGLDKISIEILKSAWKVNRNIFIYLYNNCMRNRLFPRLWKTADVRPILKKQDLDQEDPKSYRPIALLPTISKVYEKIITKRISRVYEESGLSSPQQYGFKKGLSTEDALWDFKESLRTTGNKYAVVVFADIEGAFDNLWWPAVLARLAAANCSSTLMGIMKSYFSKRRAKIIGMFEFEKRKVRQGCPQGSIIGPLAWSWVMDELLTSMGDGLDPAEVRVVAYADDLAIQIMADSRRRIEVLGEEAMTLLANWCHRNKLRLSLDKSKLMVIKGSFGNRPPVIKLDQRSMQYVTVYKYLGVLIDQKGQFIEHARRLRDKVTSYTMAVRRLVSKEWGIRRQVMHVWYKAVFIPVCTYGSTMWYDRVHTTMVLRQLLAAQRSFLLTMVDACRTVSTAALQVLAGTLPLDLEIVRTAIRHRIRKNHPALWNNYRYIPVIGDDVRNLDGEFDNLEAELLRVWQARWDSESHGRTTYGFIRNVDFRYKDNRKWFRPTRHVTYLLTGYGAINHSLFLRGAHDDGYCPFCENEEETVEHMLFHCPAYEDYRSPDHLAREGDWSGFISTEPAYRAFSEYAEEVFETRNMYVELVGG